MYLFCLTTAASDPRHRAEESFGPSAVPVDLKAEENYPI